MNKKIKSWLQRGITVAAILFIGSKPAAADVCLSCIFNQSTLQSGAQLHIASGTFDGPLTVGSLIAASLNIGAITATSFTGPGAGLTGLNAAALASGNVPTARVAGPYTGITGVGTIAAGTWQGDLLATQYGGTGQNWSTVGAGAIPFFNGTGAMTTLASPGSHGILQTNGSGAAPVWTQTPSLIGTNFSAIPLSSISNGTLQSGITVTDASLTQIAGVKVNGDISGGADHLTAPMAIGNLIAATLPTSIAASSVTASGVTPGWYGGPTQGNQIHVRWDGRIDSANQFALLVPSTGVAAGTLPTGVLLTANNLRAGTWPSEVVVNSLNATGTPVGTFGGAAQTVTATTQADGRLTGISAQLIALPLSQLNAGTLPGNVLVPAASVQSGNLGSGVVASHLANNGAVAGTYGTNATYPWFTLGPDGRITDSGSFSFTGVTAATNTVLADPANFVPNAQINPAIVTKVGNTFNGPSQLVQITAGGLLPALNAVNLTGFTAANLVGSVPTASALATAGTAAASGKLCRGVDASGNCLPAAVDAAAVSGSTNPVQSAALFTLEDLVPYLGVANTFSSSQTFSNSIYVRAQGASGPNPTPFGTPPGIFVNGNLNAFDPNASDSYVVLFGTATNTSMVSLSTGGIFGVRGGDPTGVVAYFGTTQEQSLTGKQVVAVAASANDEAAVAFTTAAFGGGFGGEVGYKTDSGDYRVFLRQGQQSGSFGSNKMLDVDVTAGKAEVRNMPLEVLSSSVTASAFFGGSETLTGDITTRFISSPLGDLGVFVSTSVNVLGSGGFSTQDSTDPVTQQGFMFLINAADGTDLWNGNVNATNVPAINFYLYDLNSGLFLPDAFHVSTTSLSYAVNPPWVDADPLWNVDHLGNSFNRSTATAAEFALQSGDVFTAAPNANVGTHDAALLVGAIKGVGTSTITYSGVAMAGGVDVNGYVSNSAIAPGGGLYDPTRSSYRGLAELLGGTVMGAYDHAHQGRVNSIASAGVFGNVSDGGGANVNIAAGIAGGYNQNGQLSPGGNAHINFQTGDNLGGDSISNPAISTRTTAGGETLTFSINGEAPQTITLGADPDAASICADIQAKVRALTAANPDNQYAYSGFNAQRWPNNSNALALVAPGDAVGVFNNTVAGPSSLVITGGTFAPLAGLGLANGGTETSGSIGTYDWSLGQGIVAGDVDAMQLDLNGLHLINGNFDTNGNVSAQGTVMAGPSPTTLYRCTGSTAGTFDGNVAWGNSNAGACSGGTWTAMSLGSN